MAVDKAGKQQQARGPPPSHRPVAGVGPLCEAYSNPAMSLEGKGPLASRSCCSCCSSSPVEADWESPGQWRNLAELGLQRLAPKSLTPRRPLALHPAEAAATCCCSAAAADFAAAAPPVQRRAAPGLRATRQRLRRRPRLQGQGPAGLPRCNAGLGKKGKGLLPGPPRGLKQLCRWPAWRPRGAASSGPLRRPRSST